MRGLTLDVLAEKTGISKPYLSNIETGRAPGPPSEEKLVRIAGAGVESRGAGGGGGLAADAPVGAQGDSENERGRRTTPRGWGDRFGSRHAGRRKNGIEEERGKRYLPCAPGAGDQSRGGRKSVGVHGHGLSRGRCGCIRASADLPDAPVKAAFALRIRGDSMLPEYAEGDMVIVGPGEAKDGDDCVVRLGRGDDFATTFKRVFFVRAADPGEGRGKESGEVIAVRLVALNQKYGERVVALEEVSGVYPLIYRLTPAKRGGGAQ